VTLLWALGICRECGWSNYWH